MARVCGIRDGQIVAVVEEGQVSSDGSVRFAAVPPSLESLTDDELMTRLKVAADGSLFDRLVKKPKGDLRVAMVGAWGIPCGISTYAEALWPELGAQVGAWTVFAEEAEGVVDGPNVTAGLWKRGESLGRLADALFAWQPDVILIQHEYGLFPDARHWLSFLARIRPLRPIVTLHSVYKHADKTICEAVIPEIAVHSELAREVLREKGITAPIHVIPHGCGPVAQKQLFNLYRSSHRFMQFGFGFRYKHWEASIEAVAELKPSLPDIFFTGLFSEGMFSAEEHERYHVELMKLAAKLGVTEHIAILRGFQSEAVLDSFLGTNSVAVFPYRADPGHVVYGASGAVRRAMQANIPVVIGPVPHFADLFGVCPEVSNGVELAVVLRKLFVSQDDRAAQLNRQRDFMRAHSWKLMAERYIALV